MKTKTRIKTKTSKAKNTDFKKVHLYPHPPFHNQGNFPGYKILAFFQLRNEKLEKQRGGRKTWNIKEKKY